LASEQLGENWVRGGNGVRLAALILLGFQGFAASTHKRTHDIGDAIGQHVAATITAIPEAILRRLIPPPPPKIARPRISQTGFARIMDS